MMNKSTKIIMIIAICMIPVGILLSVIGIVSGGKTGWSLGFRNGKGEVTSDIVTESVGLDDFDTLRIDVGSADVNIIRGDSFGIEYKVYKGKEPVITQEKGTLTVEQPSMGFVMFDFGFTSDTDLDNYTITVPESSTEIKLDAVSSSGDLMIDRVNVSGDIIVSSGDVLLNDLEGDKLDMVSSSGEIQGDKVKVREVSIKCSSGDIEMLRLESDKIRCNTSSGEIELYDSVVRDAECEASSGDVTLEFNGDPADYSYECHANSGDITVNGVESEHEYKTEGKTDKKIEVRTSSGEIEIMVK